MKTITLALLAMSMIITFSSYSLHAGIRCENDIISIGDTSSEVMMKLSRCGEVLNKEVVGKEMIVETDKENKNKKAKKEKITENWHIRVEERGGMYCYPLTFEEGRLKSIGNWYKCD